MSEDFVSFRWKIVDRQFRVLLRGVEIADVERSLRHIEKKGSFIWHEPQSILRGLDRIALAAHFVENLEFQVPQIADLRVRREKLTR